MTPAAPPTLERRELVSGWGRAPGSAAAVIAARSADEIEQLLAAGRLEGRRLIARGLGRAYGDAAQCGGGTVIDCTTLDRVVDLDAAQGTLRADAGASLDALLKFTVPRGFFLPVSPGTRFVTLGGAIASDIHGKNHHVDGSIGAHIEGMRLLTPTGGLDCGPQENKEVLAATCGGMGLTGVITEATIDLLRIETSRLIVDTVRAPDLDACLSLLGGERGRYRYSVAWVDCLAHGKHLGRSVITRGDHARLVDLPPGHQDKPLDYAPRQLLTIPMSPPVSLLNPVTAGAFNEAWFRKAPRKREGELQTIPRFFHPLDGVGNWNVLYGPRGFTQYQLVVPFGSEPVLRETLERLGRGRVASFFAVLKQFGPEGEGHLSFPMSGWTLALDIPLGLDGLPTLLDDLDELVAAAGGRVYLSKDGRLRPEMFRAMYPRLGEWRAVRDRLDPDGVLSSDLGRRLGLGPSRS